MVYQTLFVGHHNGKWNANDFYFDIQKVMFTEEYDSFFANAFNCSICRNKEVKEIDMERPISPALASSVPPETMRTPHWNKAWGNSTLKQ